MKSFSNNLVDIDTLQQMHNEQQNQINKLNDEIKRNRKSTVLVLWVLGVFQVITFLIALYSI